MKSATFALLILGLVLATASAQECNCLNNCTNDPESCDVCQCNGGCQAGYAFPDKGCSFDCSVCATFQLCADNVGCYTPTTCATDDDCDDGICGDSFQCIYNCDNQDGEGYIDDSGTFNACDLDQTCGDTTGCNECTSITDCEGLLSCDLVDLVCVCDESNGCECTADDDCVEQFGEGFVCDTNTCVPDSVVECISNDDCPVEGELCFPPICAIPCEGLEGEEECPEGFTCNVLYCEPITGDECFENIECEGDDICVDGACVEPECLVTADCGDPNLVCFQGICTDVSQTCTGDGDCLDDEVCDLEFGVCVGNPSSCVDDSQCGPTESCLANVCIDVSVSCEFDEDCPSQVCTDSICEPECQIDDDCGVDFLCITKICILDFVSCNTTDECPEGKECFFAEDTGFCLTRQCSLDSDCGDLEGCYQGQCYPTGQCASDDNCPDGESCVGGFCDFNACPDADCTLFETPDPNNCTVCVCDLICDDGLVLDEETCSCGCPDLCPMSCRDAGDETAECSAACSTCPEGTICVDMDVIRAELGSDADFIQGATGEVCVCDSSTDPTWGESCELDCPSECLSGFCVAGTGECLLSIALDCEEDCSDSSFCNPLSGECTCLFDHYYGNNTIPGNFTECLPCPNDCEYNVCDQATGECLVCDLDCPEGKSCTLDADLFLLSGTVNFECLCPDDFYGDNCTTPCPETCEFSCNDDTGFCEDCESDADCGDGEVCSDILACISDDCDIACPEPFVVSDGCTCECLFVECPANTTLSRDTCQCEADCDVVCDEPFVLTDDCACACNVTSCPANSTLDSDLCTCVEDCDVVCEEPFVLTDDCACACNVTSCPANSTLDSDLCTCVEDCTLECDAPFYLSDNCTCDCDVTECPNNTTFNLDTCSCSCPAHCPVGCDENGECAVGCAACDTETSLCVPATSETPDPEVPGDWACICPNNKWGTDCGRDCSTLCVGEVCKTSNGVCLYGHVCVDEEHCDEPNRICDPEGSGQCVCQPNTYEDENGDCIACTNCPGGLCDASGNCTAVACLDGNICQGFCLPEDDDACICAVGTYSPPACDATCHPACALDCDSDTGACPEGTVNCTLVDDCSGNGECVGVDECVCEDFFYGDACEQSCSCPVPGSDGVVPCYADGSCPYVCEQGCVNGACSFSGSVCECHEGYYGEDCTEVCDEGFFNAMGAIDDDTEVSCQACPSDCPTTCTSPLGLCPPAECNHMQCGDHELCVFPESDDPCHCPLGQYSMTMEQEDNTTMSMCVYCPADCPVGCVLFDGAPVCYPTEGEVCSEDEAFVCAHPYACIPDVFVNSTDNSTYEEPSGVCECTDDHVGADCACQVPSEEILGLCGDLWPSGYISGAGGIPVETLMHYIRLMDFENGGADDDDNSTSHHDGDHGDDDMEHGMTRDGHPDDDETEHEHELNEFCVTHYREIVCLAAFSDCAPSTATAGVASVITPACAENEAALHNLCHEPWHAHVKEIWPGFTALVELNPVHANNESCLWVECPLGTNPVNCEDLGEPDCGDSCSEEGGHCFWAEGNVPTCMCKDGYYGADCSGKCSCYSTDDPLAFTVACNDGLTGDGTCECHEGYFGADCSHACACSDNSRCNAETGRCDSCVEGFYGRGCDGVCDCGQGVCNDGFLGNGACECPENTVGDNCDPCPCENGGICEGPEECDCPTGFTGQFCELACPIGLNGEVCNGQGLCNPNDGTCVCFPGFTGDNCDDCEVGCSFGLGSCNNATGECDCPADRTGPLCLNPICEGCPDDEVCIAERFDGVPICTCDWGFVKNPETDICEPIDVTGTWGDPHFTTLDGLDYTFNGKGEFWVVQFEDPVSSGNDTSTCGVQIRTEECPGQTGVTCITSVGWTAGESIVTVQPNAAGDALSTRAGDAEIALYTSAPGIPTPLVGGDSLLDVSPEDAPNTAVIGTLCGGTSGRVVVRLNSGIVSLFLQLSDTLQNGVTGLYGNWDGDASNDFTAPGARNTLPANATESEIYESFGNAWRVGDEADALFVRLAGEASFADVNDVSAYTPTFTDDISLDPAVEEEYGALCEERGLVPDTSFYDACLFDLSATGGDTSFAIASENANALNECLSGGGSGCETIQGCPNACNSTASGTCDYLTGVCACVPDVAYGEDCSGACADCPVESTCDPVEGCVCNVDTFGEDCTPCTCGDNGDCDSETGACTCDDNFYGVNCTEACSDACEGPCDKATGECLKCPIGYAGLACDVECPGYDNSTGLVCSGNGFCADDIDGDGTCTTCESGFFGDDCSQACSENCVNNPPESLGEGSCAQADGACVCADGFYGATCNETCSANCAGAGSCDDTGVCAEGCAAGFYGATCDEACPVNCAGNGTCDDSGVCDEGCADGFYGVACNETCSANCAGAGSCDDTGVCDEGCAPGFSGPTCEDGCSVNCAGNGTCDDSGACDEGCLDGFYGATCTDACSANCGGAGSCDSVSGACAEGCDTGFHGDRCDDVCSTSCLNGACNSTTGECTDGCADDATYYGPNCELCPAGDDPTTIESESVVCSGGICSGGLGGDGTCSECPEGTEGPSCAPVGAADEEDETDGEDDVPGADDEEEGPSGLGNILLALGAGAAFLLFCGLVTRANGKGDSDSGKPALNDAGEEPMSPAPNEIESQEKV